MNTLTSIQDISRTIRNLIRTGIVTDIDLVEGLCRVTGFNVIMAAAGVLGANLAAMGAAIVSVLGALTWPIVAIGVAIIAGALLIRKYWEPISAFFSGVMEGIKQAFAHVVELFEPLKPVFDWLGDKLKAAWQWFKDLIAPVKSTQETLDSCKNAGVMFGKMLAEALMLPLKSFNTLRTGVNWLLEKLGVIHKESSDLDQKAAKANAAIGSQNKSYIPATSAYGGYQAYQPVTAPTGKTYVDQSKPEYNINLNGGIAPGSDLDRQLREAVDKLDRENRARQRSSMRHD